MIYIIAFIFVAVYSSLIYVYLHKKTHISLKYLYRDNLVNIALSCGLLLLLYGKCGLPIIWTALCALAAVPAFSVLLTILRFYRVPLRKTNPQEGGIVSPADGNIIYIKKIEAGNIPISVKNGRSATLEEFTGTGLLTGPVWLIGINMTPFDVHRNCAPVDGKLIMNRHIDGEFLSLKNEEALSRNERNSIVIENTKGKVGVVQTASRLVRRIVTWRSEGDSLERGDWFGMIKFGSQVDLIIPADCKVKVSLGQQVYVKKTVVAEW